MNKRALTARDCEELYIKYDTPKNVIGHCKEVARVAKIIAEELNRVGFHLDVELVYISGLLHDLVRARKDHGEECAKILDKMGYYKHAAIIKDHMHYQFNEVFSFNEADVMCLSDRVVKENKFVGLDARVEYLINKTDSVYHKKRILEHKQITRELISKVENLIGKTLEEICSKE